MREPVLHPRTAQYIDVLIAEQPQVLLVTGQRGIGKDYVTHYLASELLGVAECTKHPHYHHLSPADGKAIGIDSIRMITDVLRLKVPGTHKLRRVIHLSDADMMTTEAQNALLKTLEEVPSETCIILTTSQPESLLKTIRSRALQLSITKPQQAQLHDAFYPLSPDTFNKNLTLSDSLPGLLHALQSDSAHPLFNVMNEVKAIVSQDTFHRLISAERLYKSEYTMQDILWAFDRLARVAQQASIKQAQSATTRRWHRFRVYIMSAQKLARQGANRKLLLSSVVLHI